MIEEDVINMNDGGKKAREAERKRLEEARLKREAERGC